MTSLADELQADFLDLDSEGENEEGEEEQEHGEDDIIGDANGDTAMGEEEVADEDEERGNQQDRVNRALDEAEDSEEAKERIERINFRGVSDFKSVTHLWKNLKPVLEVSAVHKHTLSLKVLNRTALMSVLQQIDDYQLLSAAEQAKKNLGKSDSPAYRLMNEANNLSTHIDSEIIILHKWIRDHYSAFFAGLERLVENPIQYAKAVAIIGNGPMDVKAVGTSSDNVVGQALDKVLDKALLMSVRMEAATTQTRPLPDTEINMIMKACEMIISLEKAKDKIRAFVTSRMEEFMPNLTTLVGAETAALLVQSVGGITNLANKPRYFSPTPSDVYTANPFFSSSNLANLGWKSSRTAGASNAYGGGARQKGYIFHSPIIRAVPLDHRTQALRILSAKISLAARTDAVAKTKDNSVGLKLAEEVAKRLDVLTEAAPSRGPRALPAPDDKPSRKRGGKRARAMKERTAMSDLARAQNRLAFGKEEAESGFGTGDSTVGLGMIGQETGKIRATGIDRKTQARLSKKTQALLGSAGGSGLASSLRGFGQGGGTVTGLRTSGVGTSLGGGAGTASVIAFTEKGFGLELADPRNRDEAERKRKAEEDKYFKSGTFTNVGGGTASMLSQESKVDSAGFKVPALPALKRVKRDG
jgi:U4/U6 small nuclear ribonucleoprotein PRP31